MGGWSVILTDGLASGAACNVGFQSGCEFQKGILCENVLSYTL